MSTKPEKSDLSPAEAQQWLGEDASIQLIDVRTPEEHKEAHLAGDKLIPMGELQARLHEIDQARPVLLYCAVGGRSGRVMDFLEAQGYEVRHIDGGISAWAGEGLPYES